MKSALSKARAKLRSRDMAVVVMRLVDPKTGESIGAFVPAHPIDKRSARERKLYPGKMLRASFREDRNGGFWRKAHVLGGWLADNVEWCEGLDMHSALKRLQERSGIGCEIEELEIDIPGFGKRTGTRTVALPLDFSSMDEGEFAALWDGGTGEGGWVGWLRKNVFGGLDQASREYVESIIQKEQGA